MNEEEKGKGFVAAAASLGSDVSRSRVTGFYPDNSKRWPVYCYYLILLLCSFIFLEIFFGLLLGSFCSFSNYKLF